MRTTRILVGAALVALFAACGLPGGGGPPTTYTNVAEVEPNGSLSPQVIATAISPGNGIRLTGTAYGTNASTGDFDSFRVTLASDATTHQVTAECEPSSGNYYVVLYDASGSTLLDSGPCSEGPFVANVTEDEILVSVQNAAGTAASPLAYSVLVRST